MGLPPAAPVAIAPLEAGERPAAVVTVPGSKSLTNRALILAALADGESVLEGALFSEDSAACLGALAAAGVAFAADPLLARVRIQGRAAGPRQGRADIDVGLSGTTARFICPYLALGEGVFRVDGVPRMRQRPMEALWLALAAQGVTIEGGPALPWVLHGHGGLPGGVVRLDGNDTSQPVSGMLMVAPFSRRGMQIQAASRRAALPYVDMTTALMARFGVEVAGGAGDWTVPAGGRYRAGTYSIEPDASAACYFWAAAALTGGRVQTPGIGPGALQGDAAFLAVLERMGCHVSDEGGAVVEGPADGRLLPVDEDASAWSDQTLTLAVLGLFAQGPTTIRNVAHIRGQETDRIAAVCTELRRLGARCEERPDGLVVWPLPPGQDRPVTVATYGDHRMAMSFALAGLRRPGISIADPQTVAKTFPGYFAALERALGREGRGAR